MIVIERDGKTIVIAGWRAWVIGAVAVVVVTAVLAALAFVALGIAVGIVAFLLIVMRDGLVFPTAKTELAVRTFGNQGTTWRLAIYGSKR